MRLHIGMPEFLRYEVYLDGERLENCTEANDASGIAFVLDLNEEGRIQQEHQFNCRREMYTVEIFVNGRPSGVTQSLITQFCECPTKTRMQRGRVEFRPLMRTRDVWVSPSKD